MNKELIEKYRKHPRVLELKFIAMHTLFLAEYGTEKTSDLYKAFCDAARINWTTISSVFNRKEFIIALSTKDRLRYRQELILTGLCYGDNRTRIGRRYLGLSKRMMYEYYDNLLDPAVFMTQEWLDGLDYTVVVAGIDSYRLDIERFIEFVTNLGQVIG